MCVCVVLFFVFWNEGGGVAVGFVCLWAGICVCEMWMYGNTHTSAAHACRHRHRHHLDQPQHIAFERVEAEHGPLDVFTQLFVLGV